MESMGVDMRLFRTCFNAISVMALGLAVAAGAQTGAKISVDSAPEWRRLFDRTTGWTGADGIFSIPLSGYKGPDHAAGGKTLFVFSDTWIGNVDPVTDRRSNATMIHNTFAVLDGAVPDSSKIRFYWKKDAQGKALSAISPNTPGTAGKNAWYWLQDGFYYKGFVYILPIICTSRSGGWNEDGVAFLKIPIGADGAPDLDHVVQRDTPFQYNGSGGNFYLGCGIMPNTVESGAPNPDGYVYFYGKYRFSVARVLPDEIEDFPKWRYWDGTGWNADIGKSANLGTGGPELSVTPIPYGSQKGKYMMVSMGVASTAFMRMGDHPWGPFTAPVNIYTAPEWHAYSGGAYTYNAKVHPNLSANGDWLVSYNVNTADLGLNVAHADIYHPRFFRLRLDPATGIAKPIPSGKGALIPFGDGSAEGTDALGRKLQPRSSPLIRLPAPAGS
jgi:hypothetical protein